MTTDMTAWTGLQDLDIALLLAGLAVLLVLITLSRMGGKRTSGRRGTSHGDDVGIHGGFTAGSSKGAGKDKGADGDGDSDGGGDGGGGD